MTTCRILPCLALALCSCASLGSTPLSTASPMEGLTYFMPKQDLLLTLTMDESGKHAVSFAMTPAYPDLETGYVLHHVANGISKQTSTVGVGPDGLLATTNATTVSGLAEAAKSIGTIAGNAAGMSLPARQVAPNENFQQTCARGTHVFRVGMQTAGKLVVCNYTVAVQRISATPAAATAQAPAQVRGVFYRQAEPYLVQVDDSVGLHVEGIVFSPSNAPVRYLPIRRSLAASNTTNIAFKDGMPTSVTQDIDGEVVAVLKLPAAVVGSYFTAIGGLFESFKKRDTNEAEALAGAIKLEMAKKKYEACLVAIQYGNTAAQTALECTR